MNDDFNTVVVQTLSPSQVEEYAKLPDFEKTPDPKGMGVESIQIALPSPEEGGPVGDAVFFTTTDVLGVEPPGAPEGGAVLQGGIKVEPPPATK
jgi:hypothetical protein